MRCAGFFTVATLRKASFTARLAFPPPPLASCSRRSYSALKVLQNRRPRLDLWGEKDQLSPIPVGTVPYADKVTVVALLCPLELGLQLADFLAGKMHLLFQGLLHGLHQPRSLLLMMVALIRQ